MTYLRLEVVSVRLQLVCRLSLFVFGISVSIDDRLQVTEEYDRIKTQRVSEAVMLKKISKITDASKRCVRDCEVCVCEGGGGVYHVFDPVLGLSCLLSKQKKQTMALPSQR